MVFAKFSQEDKEAFFELLDEYFESRPHLKSQFNLPNSSASSTNAIPSRKPLQYIEALYDYNGVSLFSLFKLYYYSTQLHKLSSDDLSFKARDRIELIEKTSNDWWTCKLNGRQGLVPSNYVRVL